MMLKEDPSKTATLEAEADPPPYAPGNHQRSVSVGQQPNASTSRQPSTSHTRRGSSSRLSTSAPKPTEHGYQTRRPSNSVLKLPMNLTGSSPILFPDANGNMSTNHVAIKTKQEPITGTLAIDPGLAIPDHASMYKTKRTRRRKNNSFTAEDDTKTNALFETRQGNIDLNLSIVGQRGFSTKARVDGRTNQGNVIMNINEIQPDRHLSLDVETRRGDIHILLPANFSGPIHLYSKRGNLIFLPRISSNMRIIKAKDDEALVMITPATKIPATPAAASMPVPGGLSAASALMYDGDYVRLTSRTGNITVGTIGEDVRSAEPGWWKKVTSFLFGKT